MRKDKESNKAEELSQHLDSLNHGRHPIVQDEEINELVDLAAFVKQSYHQEELPQDLIDKVVDTLATELQGKKQKRHHPWLYSGLVGAAAAVVIAASVQFLLPQPGDHNIAQEMDGSRETPKMAAVADQPSNPIAAESANTMIPQQVPSNPSTEVPVDVPAEEKSAASASKELVDIIKVAESPEVEQKPTRVAALQEEMPTDKTMRKSVSMGKRAINSLQEAKSLQPERKTTKMLVLPNQAIQSITVDTASGDIKQVYNLGNQDEIIITQGEGQFPTQSTAVSSLSQETKDGMNSLTVKIDKYNIRIKGKKTLEELGKIAESLIEKEMEP